MLLPHQNQFYSETRKTKRRNYFTSSSSSASFFILPLPPSVCVCVYVERKKQMMDLFFRLSGWGGEREREPYINSLVLNTSSQIFHPEGGSIAGGLMRARLSFLVTSRAHRLAEGACTLASVLKKVQWQPGSLISVGDNSCCCGKKEHGPRNRRIPKAPDRRSSSSSSPTEPAALLVPCCAVCVCACLCVILARKNYFCCFLVVDSLHRWWRAWIPKTRAAQLVLPMFHMTRGTFPFYFPLTTSVACASGEEGCVCVYHSFLGENSILFNSASLRLKQMWISIENEWFPYPFRHFSTLVFFISYVVKNPNEWQFQLII